MPPLRFACILGFAWACQALSAQPIIPIGTIQGETPAEGAEAFLSPKQKENVSVRGVITQLLMIPARDGKVNHGFLLQNSQADADGKPNTSDGIFVFLGKFETLRIQGQPGKQHTPKVGQEIELDGQVIEFYNQTQLTQPFLRKLVRENVDLDKEVPALEAKPPLELAKCAPYWEALEGMRVMIPAGAEAQAGLHEDYRSGDAITWLVRADQLPNADNKSPYARRLFRDSHPLDNLPDRFDDGNGQRIILSSYGLKGAGNKADARLPAHHTFARLAKPMTGGVYYTHEQYRVAPAAIEFEAGLDPAQNEPPQATERDKEFSVGLFNVENLYDRRNNPFSQNDFDGDAGEGSIKPPFNYVPADQSQYEAHVQGLARQIVEDLHAPDIILGQEYECQDIVKLENGKLVDTKDKDADGRPDTAQDLLLAIKAAGGPDYDCAYDPMAGDTRGIVCVFLFRTDRVELAAEKESPLLGAVPPVKYATTVQTENRAKLPIRAINAPLPPTIAAEDNELVGSQVFPRAAQLALFKIYRQKVGQGEPLKLFALNNHLSSRPNARVAQRTEQARLMAAIMQGVMETHKGALALAGGDLNVFPRPDDPFPDKPSDQLGALYAAGLENLWETLAADVPVSSYSYVYDGMAQTLDQMFVTPELKARLAQIRVAHINADYPETGEKTISTGAVRRASDHDALVARFKF